jgi:hypothetical protein
MLIFPKTNNAVPPCKKNSLCMIPLLNFMIGLALVLILVPTLATSVSQIFATPISLFKKKSYPSLIQYCVPSSNSN